MNFGNIWVLLHLLWIIPLCGIIVYYSISKRRKIMKMIFGERYNFQKFSTLSKNKRYARIIIFMISLIFIFLALAQPRWGWKILPYSGKGRDLMIVLDVSKSMNAEDVKPSRLKHAKFFLRNLINSCPGDRFGLISFAGSAFLECPLTVDKTSLFQALDEVDTDSIPLGGTNIEKALATAITAFKAAEGGHRAIILVTDGDELTGNSKNEIKKLNEMKIPLFIVGIGDPEGDGLIKTTDENGNTVLLRDKNGKLVKSHLNEGMLKLLKEKTNGIYVRSVETNSGLKPILKRIKALVPKQFEKGYNKRPIERFYYPLLVAVILLLVYLSISERINEKTVKTSGAALLILFFVCLTAVPAEAQQVSPFMNPRIPKSSPGQAPLNLAEAINPEADSNEEIEKELKKAENLKNSIDIYNRALLLHKAHKDKAAEVLYKKAINKAGNSPEVRGKAFQNLGVISHAQARKFLMSDPDKTLEMLNNAESLYREAMRSDVHLKKVILNQQRLLDDRKLAKQIKKMKEQLKNQQKKAQQKTKEALNQQKKENQQNKNQKKEQNKKNDQKNNNNKQDKQKNNKNKQNKNDQNKQDKQNKNEKSDQNKSDEKQNTDRKLDAARQAVKDLKEQAEKLKNKQVKNQASEAEKELKKAQEERKKGNGTAAEKHIEKALKKLKASEQKQNKQNKNDQNKQDKQNKKQKNDQNKNKDQKNNRKQQEKRKDRNLERPDPKDKEIKDKNQSGKKENEKDIDPKQAEALLKMMADDEKKLREKLKEIKRRQAAQRKPEKDW